MFKDAIRIEWKTTGAFGNIWRIEIALETYLEERAQETWERNLRKTTLLNTCNPILVETILKVLREQIKDEDQRKTAGEIAGLVPETPIERTRRILGRSTMDICMKIWC